MAWNQPGGGGQKDDKDPWSGNSKSNPPDLEALIRNFYKKLAQQMGKKGGGSGNNKFGFTPPTIFANFSILVVLGFLLVIWFLMGIFIVDPAEQAVVLRFGKYVDTVGPGPHWIPRMIDSAYLINEQRIDTFSYDSEMLTKDENIVSVAVAVQYRINNARNYLFGVVDPQQSLQQATASALRQVIGHTNLNDVLTVGREKIRQEVQAQLTNILGRYNTGLLVTDIAIQPAKAPEEVKEAFDDAIKAQEDEQRFVNQSQAYALQVELSAKGQAQRLLADAKGYQQQVVLHAQADTAQFLALLPQYQKAPGVTRERMYLQSIESVLSNTNKVFVDSNGNNNMFYLPLDKLFASTTKPTTPTPIAPAAATVTPTSAAAPADSSATSRNDNDNRSQGGY